MAEFAPISEADFSTRTVKSVKDGMVAESAVYDQAAKSIVIRLANGVGVAFPLTTLRGLEGASAHDLTDLRIEGRGYGLHVPALDADLSIPQLFMDHLGSDLMMRALKRGAASRNNGRLGGRPKKTPQKAA